VKHYAGEYAPPHAFKPFRWWDRWRKVSECARCYWLRGSHPVRVECFLRCRENDLLAVTWQPEDRRGE